MMFWRHRGRDQARAEAAAIAERIGRDVIGRAPDSLRALVDVPDRFEEVGPNGSCYQVVVEAWPEDREEEVLRIWVAVDGPGVAAVSPVAWTDVVRIQD